MEVTNIEPENLSNREVLIECIHKETVKALEKLDIIWDRMGIDTKLKEKRRQVILEHITILYDDMLTEVEREQLNLVDNIEKLIQRLSALGKDLQTVISLDGYEEVPLNVVEDELKNKLQKYESIYNTRKEEILNVIAQEKEICSVLGQKPKSLVLAPLPQPEEIAVFRNYLEELLHEKIRRENLIRKTISDIRDIAREFKIKPNTEFEQNIVNKEDYEFPLTEENMVRLANYHKSLVTISAETREEVHKLREKVTTMWELLEENPKFRSEFLKKHIGHNVDTLRTLKQELNRCEEKKRANIKLFVDRIRKEITTFWELCRFSTEQQMEFTHFQNTCYTEDLLALHEIQLDKLKNYYETNRPIYNLINKREQLWEKFLDLEGRASDPDRYKNRGGALLREEKERKAVSSKLPKIEEELLALVADYERKNGKLFLLSGETVEAWISRTWASYKENKQQKLSAKKLARQNATITPRKSPRTPTQKCLTPYVTPAKRKIAITLFGSGKRIKQSPKNIPKIQINGSTIKRASLDRKRRMEKRQKSQRCQKNESSSTTTDYDDFENELETKPSCRSTLSSK